MMCTAAGRGGGRRAGPCGRRVPPDGWSCAPCGWNCVRGGWSCVPPTSTVASSPPAVERSAAAAKQTNIGLN